MQDLKPNKKTGKEKVWITTTGAKLEQLGWKSNEQPWTSRPNIHLQGLRAQATKPNFLHRLLDCRWGEFAKAQGMDKNEEPSSEAVLLTDIRQALPRQKKNGLGTLLTKSIVFIQNPKDRVAHHVEHFLRHGWNEPDFADLCLGPPSSWVDLVAQHDGTGGDDVEEPPAKKRRVQRRTEESAAKELAGSGMCLSDVAIVEMCGLLAANNGIFQNPPNFTVAETDVDDYRVRNLFVDPENPQPRMASLAQQEADMDTDEEAWDAQDDLDL